ncbi:MAG: sulfatase-like hydrolase/transferase [Chloroflexota bacterium]
MNKQPNVVIIMTDQQRADLTTREGFPLDTTPFQDELARQGAWFARAYTTVPACGPARVSMLTGRYPNATRVRTNHNLEDATYAQDMFEVFRGQGYQTALCGKNHTYLTRDDVDFWYGAGHLNTEDGDSTPEYQAFEDFMRETHFQVSLEPTPFPIEVQFPYRIVNKAQEWIEGLAEDNPFFLWLSFPEPHNPYQVPEPYYSMFPPEDLPPTIADESTLATKGFKYEWCRESFMLAFPDFAEHLPRARANYLGLLRLLDDQIKRFVAFLEQAGLRDDTIIIFLSDHGDFVGEYGLMRKGPNLPEALSRIPFIVTGPGVTQQDDAHPAHISIADILPTLCEAIGAKIPVGTQGRSLWPLLTGQAYPEAEFASAYAEHGFGGHYYGWDEDLDPSDDGRQVGSVSKDGRGDNTVTWGKYDCLNSWTQCGQMRMVRKGDWKLTWDMQGNGALYNLVDDPSELDNRFGQANVVEKQQELMADLLTWMLRTQDPLPLPRKRYVMKTAAHNYWT